MGYSLQQAVKAAIWKFGPLRIDPVFHLSDAGYDSNLYYGYAGNPVKDYTMTAGPGFSVYLPLKKKIIFQVDESPQYVYYFETKKERTWNNFFMARVHFALNRVFVSIGRGMSDAKQRWNTEIDIRPRLKQASWDASVLWQATKKTSFLVQAGWRKFNYENLDYGTFNIRDRLNHEERQISFRPYFQLTYRAKFFLEARYAKYDFMQVSSFKNSRSYGLYGGFDFSPLGVVRGRINVGYKVFDSRDAAGEDYKGFVGDSQVSIRLVKFLAVRASYARDIQFSLWYNNTYYLENRVGCGTSLYLIKNIRLDLDYSLGKNRYPETHIYGGESSIKRRDDYTVHSVGLYYRLKENIGLGAVASRWQRASNFYWENDWRDFVGLNLTYDF
jgi:hypothetical protein